jgi:hypothetical protein
MFSPEVCFDSVRDCSAERQARDLERSCAALAKHGFVDEDPSDGSETAVRPIWVY